MKTIILHSQDLALAQNLSTNLKGELEQRKNHFRIYTKHSFNIEQLRQSNRVDLNLFKDNFNYSEIGLFASDMDSTLVTIETIDEIAKLVGIENEVASITKKAMLGYQDFSSSFKARVLMLRGTKIEILKQVYDEKLNYSDGATELIDFLKSMNIKTALVSGGLSYFAQQLQNQLGLDSFKANHVEIINNYLTGRVIGSVVGPQEKANYINELCILYGLKKNQVLAIGDGANDLEMMRIAGLSIAYRAKPLLQKNCDVIINFSSLDSVIDFFDWLIV